MPRWFALGVVALSLCASVPAPLAAQARASANRAAATAVRTGPPVIHKVEPPNWWVPHSLREVFVLVRGQHLGGARVETTTPGIEVARIRSSASGTWLMFDVVLGEGAQPGPVALTAITARGRVSIPFTIQAPLERAGRFQGFSADDVIYLVMPDRFANGDAANDNPAKSPGLLDRAKGRWYHGGDLKGLIDKLPYLQELGVTTLWFNPVYDNVDVPNQIQAEQGQPITDFHGFGASDFYAVEERLGSMADLQQLVDRAHALGMRVIQDQVANHTGPYHPWATDAPAASWLNGTPARHLSNTFQTHLLMDQAAGAHLRAPTMDGWFAGVLPDINQADPDARRYLIQNSLWWVGMTGLDGVRQDTLPYVPRDFWRDWTNALRKEYPAVRVIGEVLDGQPTFVAWYQRGRTGWDGVDTGIDTVFDYPLYYAIRETFARQGSMRGLTEVLHQDWVYPRPEQLVTLLGSHDVRRFMFERGATLDGLRLASTFLFTTRGIPQWYAGDEIAMPGGDDPDNRRDFPGGWPGDPRNAFTAEGRTADEQAVWSHTQKLLQLRKALTPLRRGALQHLVVDDLVYAYARVHEHETVIVVLNNGGLAQDVTVPLGDLALSARSLVDRLTETTTATVSDGLLRVSVPARGAVVLVPR